MAEASSKALKNGGTFFFPRLSYKESSINSISSTPNGDGSFRVLYYGGAGSVPFTWESRPGTPKQTCVDRPRAPPLTPPPSYLPSPRASHPSMKKQQHHKSSKICIYSIFSRNSASKKSDVVVPTFSPSSSQSSSSSPPPKARSPSDAHTGTGLYEPKTEPNSPSSTLCFGPRSNGNSRMFWDVKKMVLSIVGHAKSD